MGVHINWCVCQLSWANWRLAPSLPTSPWRATAKLPNRTGAKLGICLGENVPLVTSLTANASHKTDLPQKDSLPTFIFQGRLEKAMLVSGRGSLAFLKSYRFVPCKEFPFFMRYFVTSRKLFGFPRKTRAKSPPGTSSSLCLVVAAVPCCGTAAARAARRRRYRTAVLRRISRLAAVGEGNSNWSHLYNRGTNHT